MVPWDLPADGYPPWHNIRDPTPVPGKTQDPDKDTSLRTGEDIYTSPPPMAEVDLGFAPSTDGKFERLRAIVKQDNPKTWDIAW
jgi:hypothetical protein